MSSATQIYESDADRAAAWETHKARERDARTGDGSAGTLDGIPLNLPALSRAQKLQKRAARVGFDWPDPEGVVDKFKEELYELQQALEADDSAGIREEIGDLLFSAVNLARHAGVDADTALRAGNRKFERRFRALEAELAGEGLRPEYCDLARLDALWERVKTEEIQGNKK